MPPPREIQDHLTWLGHLQPDGILVSPAPPESAAAAARAAGLGRGGAAPGQLAIRPPGTRMLAFPARAAATGRTIQSIRLARPANKVRIRPQCPSPLSPAIQHWVASPTLPQPPPRPRPRPRPMPSLNASPVEPRRAYPLPRPCAAPGFGCGGRHHVTKTTLSMPTPGIRPCSTRSHCVTC